MIQNLRSKIYDTIGVEIILLLHRNIEVLSIYFFLGNPLEDLGTGQVRHPVFFRFIKTCSLLTDDNNINIIV